MTFNLPREIRGSKLEAESVGGSRLIGFFALIGAIFSVGCSSSDSESDDGTQSSGKSGHTGDYDGMIRRCVAVCENFNTECSDDIECSSHCECIGVDDGLLWRNGSRMDLRDTVESFLDAFSDVYLHFHPRRETTAYRSSPESLAVLRHLAQSGPVSVAEAERHFGRSQAATSELLHRLIHRGLLARHPDPEDRRRRLVWLTEEGKCWLLEESRPLDETLLERAMRSLTAEERQMLVDSLARLAGAARALAREERKEQK